jgi:hypothetical protein
MSITTYQILKITDFLLVNDIFQLRWIGKDVEYLLANTEEANYNLSQNIRSSSWDWNLIYPRYKASGRYLQQYSVAAVLGVSRQASVRIV